MIEIQAIIMLLVILGAGFCAPTAAIPQKRRWIYFVGSLAMIGFLVAVDVPIKLTGLYLPRIYDPVLCRMQFIIGISGTSLFVGAAHFDKFIAILLSVIYAFLLPFVILAAGSQLIHSKDNNENSLLIDFLVAAAIGYGLYYMMPAVGPLVYDGGPFPGSMTLANFPSHPILFEVGPSVPTRNTVPSLHGTWAILIFLALRHSPLWHRILGALFLGSMVVVTIGGAYHYPIDWIIALPLVILTRGIASRNVESRHLARKIAIGSGVVLLALWVTAVRSAPYSLEYPYFLRALAAASIVLPIILEVWLERAEDIRMGKVVIAMDGATPFGVATDSAD